ncbi:MAG: acyl-CoA dehydrogenase family protein [Candidatus Rokuibacteriota bacterium]
MSLSPLETARRLGPLIRSSAAETDAQRELPRLLFETMADAGLFRLALPRTLGGAEMDLPSYVEVIEEIGRADASTAWVTNQVAIFATYAARMDTAAARAIWIDTPRSVVANTPLASAQATVVPGGYRVTGRQGFSTGCRHASWLAAHATVSESGRPRLEEGQPEMRYLFVPRDEAELLDTWQVRGMRGTGTHHFAVHDVFVPEERTVKSVNAPLVETGPLYRLPRTLVFASGDAAVALGTARSCLAAFVELATTKTPRAMDALLRDQVMIQNEVGHAEARLRSSRAFLFETVREMWTALVATGGVTLDQRAVLRLATTDGIRAAVAVVDKIYNMAGATAAYESSPIQRHFQDVHVMSQHLQARLAHYELVGRHWLGLKVDESRL